MGFAIRADFPLGGYRGNLQPGVPEPMPSVARLHAALLAAAAGGTAAVGEDGVLVPAPGNRRALEWLEENPPDAIAVPPGATLPSRRPIAYREMSLLKPGKHGIKKLRKAPTAPPSVPWVAWVWEGEAPQEVVDALERLCPDVSHLGTSESPVRLGLGPDASPTHVLDPEADLFGGGGHDIDLPTEGRTRVLLESHRSRVAQPPPRSDAAAPDEKDLVEEPEGGATALARYVPLGASSPYPLPWRTVLLIPLRRRGGISGAQRVAWAVAVHRAMISALGSAPSMLTGQYAAGIQRPPNRIAIQFLPPDAPLREAPVSQGATDVLALLIPAAAAETDEAAVLSFGGHLDRQLLRGPSGQDRPARLAGDALLVPAAGFWRDPTPGVVRRWRTVPAAVPETRGPRGGGWDLADAALHSIALAFRGIWDSVPKGDPGLHALRAQALHHGIAVETAEPITDTRPDRYVHKVRPGTVVRPYRADLDLGGLGEQLPLLAIGQSRHLGGGLLVPHDMEEGSDG